VIFGQKLDLFWALSAAQREDKILGEPGARHVILTLTLLTYQNDF
jgi:hypothetical protein